MRCLLRFAWPLLAALGLGSAATALAAPPPSGFVVQQRDDGAGGAAAGAWPKLLAERSGPLTSARALGGHWHAVQPAAALDGVAARALEARLRADPRVRAVVPDGLLPVRVAGKCGAAVSDIIDGLRWAAGLAVTGVPNNPNPARLIVLSCGGVDPCDSNSANAAVRDTARLYEAALAEVRAAGALVFVAAGNQRGAVGRPGTPALRHRRWRRWRC